MLMIVKEIKRLCSMSLEEIHEWYHEMEDVLKHNWKRICGSKSRIRIETTSNTCNCYGPINANDIHWF